MLRFAVGLSGFVEMSRWVLRVEIGTYEVAGGLEIVV